MTIDDQNKDEKIQYDINIETVKTLVLSSGKIYKYEYFTGEEILPFIRNQIIENLWKNKPSIKQFISKQRLNPEITNDTQLIHNFSMVLIHIKAKNWKMFC